MMKVPEGLPVDLEVRDLAPLGDDSVVSLVLGDRDVAPDDVADRVELLGALSLDLFELFLSRLNLFFHCVGLGLLLLALVSALRLLHLLCYSL